MENAEWCADECFFFLSGIQRRIQVLILNHFSQVIDAVVPAEYLDDNTIYHLQPSGRFVIGGPQVTITQKVFSFIKIKKNKPLITFNFVHRIG